MSNTRRDFIKKAGLASAVASLTISASYSNVFQQSESSVMPNDIQKKWMDLGFGLFIHFGINTYYDKEWSDGSLDVKKFNPTEFDSDQWCHAAKAAGMKYLVLVTKHHDGFCNWPTKQTEYCVSSTPWKGDVVGEVAKSCKKYGIKLGLYYSLWDRHEKTHDTDEWAYVEFMKAQLYELLTGYGEVIELWFDGFWKKQQSGWEKQITDDTGEKVHGGPKSAARDDKFIQAWRNEGNYRWQMDHVYQYIKSLQPNCLVMNNSTTAYPGVPLHPVDIRSGEKATKVFKDKKVWNFLGKDIYMPMQIETTLSQEGRDKFPSGSWFWHEWDHSVASKEKIKSYLDIAKKMNANLLLNAGIMANGKMRPEDVKALTTLNK